MKHRIVTTDLDIVLPIAEFRRLDTDQLEHLTGRMERSVQRRVKELLERGYLIRRVPALALDRPVNAPVGGYVYYLALKGYRLAQKNGFTGEWTHAPSSPQNLTHDCEVSWFHIFLKQSLPDGWTLEWHEGRVSLLDHVYGDGQRLSVNPDGLAILSNQGNRYPYFCEIEKSRGEAYRKLAPYFHYRDQGAFKKKHPWMQDFRVIFSFMNEEREKNFLARANAEFPFRMFWTTTEEKFRAGMFQDVFKTPRDYKDRVLGDGTVSEARTYSFLPEVA